SARRSAATGGGCADTGISIATGSTGPAVAEQQPTGTAVTADTAVSRLATTCPAEASGATRTPQPSATTSPAGAAGHTGAPDRR
ncbi:hypothetical protein BST27_31100, partial [Mycobacterium intermedium]